MNDTAKVVLFGVVSAACSAGAIDIYVSPTGDDAAPGSAAAPLKTLTAARDRVRWATAIERVPGVTIWLNPGVYALEEALELNSSDSGVAGAPVIWRATKRGTACVSGFKVCAWSPVAADDPNGRLVPKEVRSCVRTTTLPTADDLPGFFGDYVSPNDYPYVLFRKGRELPNARWPNDDEWDLPKPDVTKPAKGAQTFAIRTGADAARLKA